MTDLFARPDAPASPPESSDLAVATDVARQIYELYRDSRRDGFTYPKAYGAQREALRLLLRALGAEPITPPPGEPIDEPAPRCPAAHPDDPTPCTGPATVTVLDASNAGADGCEHHGARLLASLTGGRVYPLPDAPDGAAIRAFKAAADTRPFAWVDTPRTRPEQLSRNEAHARGEAR